jgi:hypothetical protein
MSVERTMAQRLVDSQLARVDFVGGEASLK